jgi:ribosome-associated translation inhibitor RaiA
MALRNAKAQLKQLKTRVTDTRMSRKELEEKFIKIEREKQDMYTKFEVAIDQLRRKTDYKNAILDEKLGVLSNELDRKEVQLNELV